MTILSPVRLFTGISIDPAVVERLNEVIGPLRSQARLQWSPPQNFHITTKFLGERPAEELDRIQATLQRMPKPAPFTLELERLGLFPNAYRPRVLWAGVRASQALAQLAHDTDLVLANMGVPSEKRKYSPHLTLARIKPDVPLEAVQSAVREHKDARFGPTAATEFHLYLSRPAAGGSIYEKLVSLPFATPQVH